MKKIVALLSLTFVFTLWGCSDPVTPPSQVINPEAGLETVQSVDELRSLVTPYLNDGLSADGWFFRSGFFTTMASPEMAMEEGDAVPYTGSSEEIGETSQTNVQIAGVDEGDIIKTDGTYIYRISGNQLTVVELLGEGAMETVLTLSMESEAEDERYTYYREIYLTDEYIVAVGQRQMYYSLMAEFRSQELPVFEMGTPFSTITLIDRASLEVTKTFDISGSINTTRLIDDQLYVMSYHSIYSLDEDFNPLPVFKEDGEERIPDVQNVRYLPDTRLESFTILSHIDLSNDPTMESEILLGTIAWGQTYVNLDGITLASTQYTYNESTGRYESYGEFVNYTFNLDGSLSFGGVGNYQGNIQNQFWMDGVDEFFRLVTTEGFGENAINRLFIFERKTGENGPYFEAISTIEEGLGKPGETIRSARFNGDLVTVVTFEQTDPLYTIDLSDPYNPIIRAGLEISGFSTYQHPWKNDTLIGVGYEADSTGRTTGIKLTLFDISDLDNPVEIGRPLVLLNSENNWQYSEALHNHKAILIGESYDFIGFAMGRSGYTDAGYFYGQDYLIFEIDESREMPIQIATDISHLDLIPEVSDGDSESDEPFVYYSAGAMIERAVYSDDVLYVISNLGITSHNLLDDYSEIDTLVFDE